MYDIEEVYKTHYKYVKSYALSLCFDETLAEDITQETFLRAIKSADSFRGECRIETWLCAIAKNIFLSHNGKKKTENTEDHSGMISSFSVISESEEKETVKEVLGALNSLPSPYKDVFYMKAFGELSYEVIADVFDKTESWARVTYFRARKMISERIESNGEY